jgi:hypothetical protein
MKGTRVKMTKPVRIPLVAPLWGVAGIAGLMLAHAQETVTATAPATVTIPLSHTDLAAIQRYSDAQLTQLLSELAATPLTWPDDLPNKGMRGTYWSLAHPDWPPLPATFGAPVWILGGRISVSCRSKRASKNPKGIPSQSPGLRGTSHPGLIVGRKSQPQRGCVLGRSIPKVARSSQPWAEGHNPFGIEPSGHFSKTEMHPLRPGSTFAG